ELLPFGVGAEFLPVALSGLAAFVSHDEDERIFGRRRILRNPVPDARDAVLLQERDVVVAKIRLQRWQTARKRVIDAELEDAARCRLVALSVGQSRGDEGAGGQGKKHHSGD